MIYIHVPFCKSFCTYCGFYSEVGECNSFYVDALCAEIRRRGPLWRDNDAPQTVYLGGGTPSLLAEPQLRQIFMTLLEVFGPDFALDECTIEVNPDDVIHKPESWFQTLKLLGISRISMGVQSFQDDLLRWMNRRHSAAEAIQAYNLLRAHGFTNISLDLIFGIAGYESISNDIEKMLELNPEHISCYQLSVDENSALASRNYVPLDDEICSRQYAEICTRLKAAGYEHYEISNFAKNGHRALHNSAYWTRQPYVGFGPGAHSLKPDLQTREWNAPDLKSYLAANPASASSNPASASSTPASSTPAEPLETTDRETLSREQIRIEKIMLGLRTQDGISEYLLPKEADLEKHLHEGTLERIKDDKIRIPEEKWFVSDNIIAQIVSFL